MTATVWSEAGATAVADPRLSTTLDARGLPVRLGLELWLHEHDEETEQYPRRATAEAIWPEALAEDAGSRFIARALRCLSQGEEGSGVLLVMQP